MCSKPPSGEKRSFFWFWFGLYYAVSQLGFPAHEQVVVVVAPERIASYKSKNAGFQASKQLYLQLR